MMPTRKFRAGACLTLLCLAASQAAQAAPMAGHCASAAELSAVQVAAVNQELTDAALACGPGEMAKLVRFQTVFRKELNRSDGVMKTMFRRLLGGPKGEAAYDAYKTRAIAHAEQRRIIPGEAANFCRTANIVFAAALAPDKPVLEDFVAGVPVHEDSPVDVCEIKVSTTLQGVAAGPAVNPTPRPDLPGDPPSPGLFP